MVGTRKELIRDKLSGIIGEMSGLSDDDIDPQESFLDLGFDSLFLTQANLRFRREFKVKITFRQLFDEAPCIDALADYIDGELPEDALQEELAAATAPPNPPAGTPAQGTAPGGAGMSGARFSGEWHSTPMPSGLPNLMQVLFLQNQTNTALLQALAGNGNGASATPTLDPPAAHAGALPAAPPVAPDSNAEDAADESASRTPKALGPYKPVEKSSGGLDGAARDALQAFCEEYTARTPKSKALAESQRGVLSDARSISGFRRDWKEIVYQIAAGDGSKGVRVWDLDGNEYIDLTSSFGISLFGHSPDWAVDAAKKQLEAGFELGTLSPLAEKSADLIRELTGMDRSTFTNTGSEALAAAVRAARTTTAKDRIAVFYDEYHGIGDELLVNCIDTRKGRRTIPTSPGIPNFIVENVLVLKWDDDDFIGAIRENADELAAVIIEPVQNRNPSLKTNVHFQAIREVTREHNIALIFDEMITGFRLAPGGAQEYFDVEVDMACYGKILSGGLPLAVVSGRGSYLDCFDGGPWQFGDDSFPEAGVTFFGGTFTRHPISLATCHAALVEIARVGQEAYDELNAKSRRFANRLNELLIGSGYPARIENRESVFNLKWDDANPFSRLLLWQLRHRGVLIYDRPFFMTTAHSEEDLETVLQAFRDGIAFLLDSGIVPRTALDGDVGGDRVVPFSQSQTEVWLATQLSPEASKAFHEQVIYELDGPVNVEALRHALQRVVHRHEVLRARENPKAEGWTVAPAAHVPVHEVDLRSVDASERPAELARLIEEDVGTEFDLIDGAPIRVTLYRTDDERFTLVIAAHHLAIDGWSMGILLVDLAKYYGAACRQERFGAPSPHSLTTFLADEAEYLASDDYRETETFWVEQFVDDLPEPLHLPLDRPRPDTKSYPGIRQSVRFDPELVDAINRFGTAHKVTNFTTLYAGFAAFMAHLTGQSDVVVGVPMAGQAVAGQPNLVGHAVNFLPLRSRVDLGESFDALLARTRNYILELNDHQRYTYASLLKKLPVKRTADQVPLVSVTFNVDQGMESFDFHGVEARYVVGPRQYVKHDLFVNVVMESDGPILEVDHNSDILDSDTVLGWIDGYFHLLRAITKDPSAALEQQVAKLAGTSGSRD